MRIRVSRVLREEIASSAFETSRPIYDRRARLLLGCGAMRVKLDDARQTTTQAAPAFLTNQRYRCTIAPSVGRYVRESSPAWSSRAGATETLPAARDAQGT